ncbi:endoplasmic reticulum junction formation protein lunapark-B isoform X1 [Clupea harengus]|uniref:Endoplasmic reticulum junction formation protein lunapark n=1 Tax=Clupea harengus TaxID=7950 RepID=A0A6P8EPS5_CLUHA|nr:endoplasmic reticulum junction formation protein lunapark-B isoform X1 [Clupea harengus]
MGAVLSRWKAKPSTVEVLESLDKDIKDLEEFRAKNQRLQKLWVGRLLFYSSMLYLFVCFCVYFCYMPDEWSSRVVMALPLLAFPMLVWFVRKLLIFLFSKRTERNNDKLEDLKVEKKKILEEVMENETYKNAKLILERFDPDSKKKMEAESTPSGAHMTPRPDLRRRIVPMGTPVPGQQPGLHPGATPAGPPMMPPMMPRSAPGGPPEMGASAATPPQTPVRRSPTPYSPHMGPVGQHPPGPQLVRPVLPRERGPVDRVIEYLVGDGPQNRYALICQQCFSHNGMALKEEYEFIAYRCAYCYFLNPARKTRPQAPRLPEFSFERRLRSASPAPESSEARDSDAGAEDSDAGTERIGGTGGVALGSSSSPSSAAAPWSKVHSFSRAPNTGEPEVEMSSDQHDTDEAPSTQEVMEEEEEEESDVPLSRRSPSPMPQEESEVGGTSSRRQEEEEPK